MDIVAVQAIAGTPKLVCSAQAVAFDTCVLERPVLRRVQLTNEGTCALDWHLDSPPGARVQVRPRKGSVEAGESVTLGVKFLATDLAPLQEILAIHSDGGDVRLLCTGSVLLPQLVFPPTGVSHSFGYLYFTDNANKLTHIHTCTFLQPLTPDLCVCLFGSVLDSYLCGRNTRGHSSCPMRAGVQNCSFWLIWIQGRWNEQKCYNAKCKEMVSLFPCLLLCTIHLYIY